MTDRLPIRALAAAIGVVGVVTPWVSVSAIVALVLFVGMFIVATSDLRPVWSSLPTSLRLVHYGVGIMVAAVPVRLVETIITGDLQTPSIAEALAIPGYLLTTVAVFEVARARAATARVNDLVDALVSATMPIAALTVVGWDYLAGATGAPIGERVANGLFFAVDGAFLATMLLIIYGQGRRSSAATWLGAAGVIVIVVDFSYFYAVVTGAGWADEPVRLLPFTVLAYAIAVADPDYKLFATSGTRPQQHRSLLYPCALGSICALAFVTQHLVAVTSVVLVVVLLSARITIASRTSERLERVASVQAALAEALSEADTTADALAAATTACRSLVNAPVTIRLSDALGPDQESPLARAMFDRTAPVTFIHSTSDDVVVEITGSVASHDYVAIAQVANVVDPAVRSISERTRRLQLEAQAEAESAWQAITDASHVIGLRAKDGVVTRATSNASGEFGFNPVDLAVDDVASLVHPLVDSTEAFEDPYRPNRWIRATVTDQADGSIIYTIQDVTSEYEAAHTDPVTGLATIEAFTSEGNLSNSMLLVLSFSGTDRFLTEGATPSVLRHIANVTRGVFRESEDQMWRGEEQTLIVVTPLQNDIEWVDARRLELAESVKEFLPGRFTITVGMAEIDQPLPPTSALIRANIALKHGQLQGGDTTVLYTADIEAKMRRTWSVEKRLNAALNKANLEEHGFRVEYQPIVDANTTEPVAAEALIRWTHPELGPVYPDEFIYLAEEAGLVDRIDRYVLSTVIGDLANFQRYHPKFKIHVNLSPESLQQPALGLLFEQLRRARPEAPSIVLEVTEHALGKGDLALLAHACTELSQLGPEMSIDDFGDGESNFARVSALPVAEVKLARHFAELEDPLMVESVVQSIHLLGKRVVAENVETETQAEILRASGVDLLQGYLFFRPRPLDDTMMAIDEHDLEHGAKEPSALD